MWKFNRISNVFYFNFVLHPLSFLHYNVLEVHWPYSLLNKSSKFNLKSTHWAWVLYSRKKESFWNPWILRYTHIFNVEIQHNTNTVNRDKRRYDIISSNEERIIKKKKQQLILLPQNGKIWVIVRISTQCIKHMFSYPKCDRKQNKWYRQAIALHLVAFMLMIVLCVCIK